MKSANLSNVFEVRSRVSAIVSHCEGTTVVVIARYPDPGTITNGYLYEVRTIINNHVGIYFI